MSSSKTFSLEVTLPLGASCLNSSISEEEKKKFFQATMEERLNKNPYITFLIGRISKEAINILISVQYSKELKEQAFFGEECCLFGLEGDVLEMTKIVGCSYDRRLTMTIQKISPSSVTFVFGDGKKEV